MNLYATSNNEETAIENVTAQPESNVSEEKEKEQEKEKEKEKEKEQLPAPVSKNESSRKNTADVFADVMKETLPFHSGLQSSSTNFLWNTTNENK